MPTIPQRLASALAILCGRYGDVTKMTEDREQSRQSLYREAEQVAEAADGTGARAQIEQLQRQLAERQAEVNALQKRLKHAVEITPDKQHEFAAVAQAEGVSLSVSRSGLDRGGLALFGLAAVIGTGKAGVWARWGERRRAKRPNAPLTGSE